MNNEILHCVEYLNKINAFEIYLFPRNNEIGSWKHFSLVVFLILARNILSLWKNRPFARLYEIKKKKGEVFNWANDVKKYYKGFVYTRFTLTWELRACLYRIEHVKGDSRGDNYPQTTHKPATDVPRWVYAIRLFIQAENRSWNKLLQYQAE